MSICVSQAERKLQTKAQKFGKIRYISMIRSSLEWAGISDACEGEGGDKAAKIDRDQSQRSLHITP